MDSKTIRSKYLNFFKSQNHAIIDPAPLIPENDPTTLFTSAGMQQLISYLKGETHPQGTRLTDSQPSFRSQDIEEVGDNRHTTFFEMLGNWSLGDYFKKEQIAWVWQFLTKEINLDPKRLYVTVYAGSQDVSKDDEAIEIWQKVLENDSPAVEGLNGFDKNTKIYTYTNNWWSRAGEPVNMPVGEIGGPDSEVFYDFDPDETLGIHQNSEFAGQKCHPNCDCGRFLEIGNSVFMQFEKTEDGFKALPKQNVDFGGGLERILAACNNTSDIFQTDLFLPLIEIIEQATNKSYSDFNKEFRIIADHIKASVFMIAQGLEPDNKAQGYFLRRLIRRALLKLSALGDVTTFDFKSLVQAVSDIYSDFYPEVASIEKIAKVIQTETDKFTKTLIKGLREFEKIIDKKLTGELAFKLYETYGFPLEISIEEATQRKIKIEKNIEDKFEQVKKAHSDKSRSASKGMFKGGLGGDSNKIVKFHTTTHLLHQALRLTLGDHVGQAGSNITEEKLRFDFTHSAKLTPEQVKQVEDLINSQIKKKLPVNFVTMTLDEAKEQGALAFFSERYSQEVKVYSIGDFSKEVCGGPHVENTKELGHFRIGKQKSIGSGKIRIYGYLD